MTLVEHLIVANKLSTDGRCRQFNNYTEGGFNLQTKLIVLLQHLILGLNTNLICVDTEFNSIWEMGLAYLYYFNEFIRSQIHCKQAYIQTVCAVF